MKVEKTLMQTQETKFDIWSERNETEIKIWSCLSSWRELNITLCCYKIFQFDNRSVSSRVQDMAAFLPYVIPTCVQRLGQQEITETCEELRLLLMELLTALVDVCKEKMAMYIDDLVKILQKTIADPFHHVKKVRY